MQDTDQNTGFYGGSLLAILYNLYMFFNLHTPFFADLLKTILFAVVGVFISGLASYIFKKILPKIFKK